MEAIKQACQILGVPETASLATIEAAFLKKQEEYRADPGSDPWDFQDVQQAFRTLRESHRKGVHTRTGTSKTRAAKEVSPPAPVPLPKQKITNSKPVEMPKHLVWQTFFRELPLQNETSVFVLVNVLDIFMTWGLLKVGGIETNPIANYFLQRWGFDGMIALKMLSVAFVVVLVQQIATRDLTKAKRLLIAGTAIVFTVVVYSGVLLSRTMR
ncbi:hypothetical protein Poly24_49900 [Rosistilla carotiformis]|uniref:DUF5658 domain-containing protein n=1 Tax=Rosistilla carotiformis TaxID=2528017 RepID=A0A518K0I1_9BACT|nr:DUF5658 family protein [Rosistilla carotiformis]QDV71255.1 hypothetical protein Poly24_49900 [Rosistilla carotiformis]